MKQGYYEFFLPAAETLNGSVLRAYDSILESGEVRKTHLFEGRYGPYVSDGSANASIPKDMDPSAVTLEQALEWLADAPKRKRRAPRRRTASRKKKTAK